MDRDRRPLARERVVAAALHLVDRRGLGQLTMRNLGQELGVDPMAPYHWFPNKRAILQGVYEQILDEVEVPEPEDGRWPDVLASIARSYRQALLAHPNALPMISTEPVMTVGGLRLVERAAAALVGSGLSAQRSIEVINGIAALVIGSSLAGSGTTAGTDPIGSAELESLFANLDRGEFPTLTDALEQTGQGTFRHPDETFDQLLTALIAGFEHALD